MGVDTDTEVKEWGNSLAVRLPRDQLKAAGIKPGDKVRVHVEPARGKHPAWGLLRRLGDKRSAAEVMRDFQRFRREERKQERAREKRRGY